MNKAREFFGETLKELQTILGEEKYQSIEDRMNRWGDISNKEKVCHIFQEQWARAAGDRKTKYFKEYRGFPGGKEFLKETLKKYGSPLDINRFQEVEIWIQKQNFVSFLFQALYNGNTPDFSLLGLSLEKQVENLLSVVNDPWFRTEKIKKMDRLTLTCVNLTEIPSIISIFENLTELHLDFSPISVLPPEIYSLKKLEKFTFAQTHITRLSPLVTSLSNLKHISTSYLETIPQEIGQLQQLTCIRIRSIPFKAILPTQIWKLSLLEELSISNCVIDEIPRDLNLPALKNLLFTYCKISTIPPEINKLGHLDEIHFCDSHLENLPKEIESLPCNLMINMGSTVKSISPELFDSTNVIARHFARTFLGAFDPKRYF